MISGAVIKSVDLLLPMNALLPLVVHTLFTLQRIPLMHLKICVVIMFTCGLRIEFEPTNVAANEVRDISRTRILAWPNTPQSSVIVIGVGDASYVCTLYLLKHLRLPFPLA
jgi:hypothetical protein